MSRKLEKMTAKLKRENYKKRIEFSRIRNNSTFISPTIAIVKATETKYPHTRYYRLCIGWIKWQFSILLCKLRITYCSRKRCIYPFKTNENTIFCQYCSYRIEESGENEV